MLKVFSITSRVTRDRVELASVVNYILRIVEIACVLDIHIDVGRAFNQRLHFGLCSMTVRERTFINTYTIFRNVFILSEVVCH